MLVWWNDCISYTITRTGRHRADNLRISDYVGSVRSNIIQYNRVQEKINNISIIIIIIY